MALSFLVVFLYKRRYIMITFLFSLFCGTKFLLLYLKIRSQKIEQEVNYWKKRSQNKKVKYLSMWKLSELSK